MIRKTVVAILFSFALTSASGCATHRFLGGNTIRQTQTLSSLIEQQVLDNLAAFGSNPGSLPQFAIIGDGTSQVQDGGSITPSLAWNFTTFTGATLPIQASRQVVGNWKLQPVMNAGRLKRIRCAYQIAYATPIIELQGTSVCLPQGCVNCIGELVSVGLLPKPSKNIDKKCDCPDDLGWQFATEEDAQQYHQELLQSIECNIPSGWFCIGTKKDALRSHRMHGMHNNSYAWVKPGRDEEFSRFTLTILALATTDPKLPSLPQEVSLSFGKSNAALLNYLSKPNDQISSEDVQQIQDTLNRIERQESDIFSRPGSMPFSRGGGIEFTP